MIQGLLSNKGLTVKSGLSKKAPLPSPFLHLPSIAVGALLVRERGRGARVVAVLLAREAAGVAAVSARAVFGVVHIAPVSAGLVRAGKK